MISREVFRDAWERIAGDDFVPFDMRPIEVDGHLFQAILAPRVDKKRKHQVFDKLLIQIDTNLSFFAAPRLIGFPQRCVLLPKDTLGSSKRWALHEKDVEDWVRWANGMNHIVTMSTFKSGAGVPFSLHAQCIPLQLEDGTRLSALSDAPSRPLVPFGEMPFFQNIKISSILGYPIGILKIEGKDSLQGLGEVSRKVFELAVNYDDSKSFNLVILPAKGLASEVLFIPRRKDGMCIYGPNRWQIGALEVSGLMASKTAEEYESLDAGKIKHILRKTCIDSSHFESFEKLTRTF